jgi:hypothetical protein
LSTAASETRGSSALAPLVGALALAAAMIIRWGDQPAELIALALLLFGLAALAGKSRAVQFAERAVPFFAVVGLAGFLATVVTAMGLLGPGATPVTLTNCGYGWIACGACAFTAIATGDPRYARLWLAAALLVSTAMCVAIVRLNPSPPLDVHLFHLGAFEALRAHRSPYGSSIPNIYPGANFYGSEVLSRDQTRVLIGYPYPPLQLLLAFAAQTISGDYRLFHALALPLSAALMAWARPSRNATIAAALMALLPSGFFLLAGAWTEPALALFVSLTLFVSLRTPRFLPFALGLFFADKQYAPLLTPLAFFLLPRPRSIKALVRTVLLASAVAIAVTLPLALADPRGFIRDVLLFQIRQPFRADSLSLSAAIPWLAAAHAPSWICFTALAMGLLLSLWRAPKTPYGFCISAAFSLGLFFGFAKQSFENYLMFITCCALWAVALSGASAGESGPAAEVLPDAGNDANASAMAANPQVVTQGT